MSRVVCCSFFEATVKKGVGQQRPVNRRTPDVHQDGEGRARVDVGLARLALGLDAGAVVQAHVMQALLPLLPRLRGLAHLLLSDVRPVLPAVSLVLAAQPPRALGPLPVV